MSKRTWHPVINQDVALVPLTQGQWATIDIEDLDIVQQTSWSATRSKRTWYAKGSKPGFSYMHRVVMGLPIGDPRLVDHVDGDGLNNRRSNLRVATSRQNAGNQRKRPSTSRFKGVKRHHNRWVATIKAGYRSRHLGSFVSEEDAGRAYDAAAVAEWGEFAVLNFPLVPLSPTDTPEEA